MQEGKQGGEDVRVVVKPRLAQNLVTVTLNRSPTGPSSSSSHSPGNLRAHGSTLVSLSTGKLVAMDSNENSASSSQVWHTDSVPNSSTGKLVARSKKSTIGQCLIPHNLARQCRVYGQGLRARTTETWSSKRGQNGAGRHQRYDLGNIWDCVLEGSGTSRKTL